MNIFVPENGRFNHKPGLPLSSTNILCLRDYPHNLTKYKNKGTSKIPISPLFSELGKIWKWNLGLYSKNRIFHLFHELGKIEKSRQSNTQKPHYLFVNWEKLGSTTA